MNAHGINASSEFGSSKTVKTVGGEPLTTGYVRERTEPVMGVVNAQGAIAHTVLTPRELLKQNIKAVCAAYRVDYDDVMGLSRIRAVVDARYAAIAMVKRETALSPVQIGLIFKRDPTSIYYALGRTSDGVVNAKKRAERLALVPQRTPVIVSPKGKTREATDACSGGDARASGAMDGAAEVGDRCA